MQLFPTAFAAPLAIFPVMMLTGCVGQVGDSGVTNNNKTAPTKIKEPKTAEGCGGVTELGKCDGGVAVRCEIAGDTGTLSSMDCQTLGQSCVVEATRGAECRKLEPPPPGGGGSPCESGVSEAGVCGDGYAIWCDAESKETLTQDCGALGMSCEIDSCGSGAGCCNPQPEECAYLGFFGECGGPDGQTARWCIGDDGKQLAQQSCAAQGQICELDPVQGAQCVDAPLADRFEGSLDGWTAVGPFGYSLQLSSGAALIAGDSFVDPYHHSGGMQKVVTITPSAFKLAFRWRAASALAAAEGVQTTNAYLEVLDAGGTTVLHSEPLFEGGGDTNWQSYSKDLSAKVAQATSVTVRLYLNDRWSANHDQRLYVDDVAVR
jgi:hypothetical protein